MGLFVLFNILNLRTGWADNGDFTRMALWFSSGPALISENFPALDSPEWPQRFFQYWIPYWKLDFPLKSEVLVSALFLWWPGVLINYYLFSTSILWVPLASLGARVALLALLWKLLGWIERRSPYPNLHFIALGLPLVLLFTTADVAAFYNSFYQESGTLVFLPLVLAVIIWGYNRPRNIWFYAVYLVAITLLTMSKTACFYWAVLALPFVVPLERLWKQAWIYLPLATGLLAIPLVAGLTFSDVPNPGPNRAYNSLYDGVLLLSDAPQQRLAELGLADSANCIGVDWYAEGGMECSRPYWDQINYTQVVRVILAEPLIVLKQAELLADRMQNLDLGIGRYAYRNPIIYRENRLNAWSVLKQRYFPRGVGLLIACGVILAGIGWTWREKGIAGSLARVGLICLLAMIIDGYVEVLGDGHRDLLKHMLVPNLLFDFAWLTVFSAALTVGLQRLKGNPLHKLG